MKTYVQFLDYNLKRELADAIGSFGILIVDGRLSINTVEQIGRKECAVRKYPGFEIRKGDKPSRAKTVKRVMVEG